MVKDLMLKLEVNGSERFKHSHVHLSWWAKWFRLA
jgi:hypothetical protein